MEKKNNNLVIILMGIIIVILAVLCVLFATNTITFNNGKNEIHSDSNLNNEDNFEYNVNDYIVVEKEKFEHDGFEVFKISFKNLDSNLTQAFLNKQDEMIKDAHYNDQNYGSVGFGVTYEKTNHLLYQINNNILTVYYETESGASDAFPLEECILTNVINIDLKNHKLLTNKEILEMGNGSFENIANEEYEKTLKFLSEDNTHGFISTNNKVVHYEEFKNNKDNYLNQITNNLESVINSYIQDGVVKYEYDPLLLPLTYQNGSPNDCIPHKTVIVGKIK